jgi:putative transcriptional regulator
MRMLEYRDCGLKGVWLASGYRWETVEGVGECLEIEDVDGLHGAIAHHLVHYRKRLSGPEIRFLRVEMGLSQKRLADTLGVEEQTVSLWERSQRRPTVAAERMLRLLYLEHADGTTKLAELIERWNETDRLVGEEQRTTAEKAPAGWKIAA